MYDFVKIRTRLSNPEHFVRESGLPFVEGSRTDTGEVIDFWTAELKNMQLCVYQGGTFLIKGSVHKYHNRGEHNYDSFTLDDYKRVIQELSERISQNLWKYTIDTLEVGVNVSLPIATKEFLDNTYRHKSKGFKDVSVGPKGDYRQAAYSDYFVKIYDKGLQYGKGPNLMRFEVKLKADELRKLNINLLKETENEQVVARLKEILLQRFAEVVFIDPSIRQEELTDNQRDRLLLWYNPRFWEELQRNPWSRNSYANEIKKLRKTVSSHSDQIQDQVKHIIKEKLGFLAPVKGQEGQKSGKNGSGGKGDGSPNGGKKGSSYIIPSIPSSRTCLVTGLDISMQKEESHFLFTTGVEYYRVNNPEIYNDLEKRLSPKWDQVTTEKRNLEIAHSIRNEFFNWKYKWQRIQGREAGQYSMFDDPSLLNPRIYTISEVSKHMVCPD